MLVVEDTVVTRFSVRQVLQDHGYEVEEAASGEEALAKAAAQPEPLDLIILDIFLPGMDGLAVLRELKARPKTRHTPVMLLTASSSAAIVRQAIDLGAVDYLVKPFSPEELVRRVERLIGPGRRRGEGPLADLLAALRLEANRASRANSVFSLVLCRRSGAGSRRTAELESYVKRRLRDIDAVVAPEPGSLALILPATGAQGAEVVTRKVKEWLAALEPEAKWEFGVAAYPENGSDPAALYSCALAALSGRGQPAGRGAPEKDGGRGEDGPGAAGGPAG